MKKILFSCGDRSADKYLSELLKSINRLSSEIDTIVLGGELSKQQCKNFFEDLVGYDAHGFFAPIILIPKFLKLVSKIKKLFLSKIDLVVLLDYYGFNIRLAKLAKRYGISVIYYITPQIWATRKYRLKKIKKYADFVINIYPFEQQIYRENGIETEYYGHPIMDILDFNIKKKENMIGIFPGSRKQVIKWNLPLMLKVVEYISKNYFCDRYDFVVFGFEKYNNLYKKFLKKYNLKNIKLCYNNEYRKKIIFAISVSGTIVLENLLYEIPMVIVYKLPILMYWLIKKIILVKYISLPNIILNRGVIKEFIQDNINYKIIADYIINIIHNKEEKNKLIDEYHKIKNILLNNSDEKVSEKVAKKIIEYAYETN